MNEKLKAKIRSTHGKGVQISVGDGWYDLVQELLEVLKPFPVKVLAVKSESQKLKAELDFTGFEPVIGVNALRRVRQFVSEYSDRSKNICQYCGNPSVKTGICGECDHR